MRVNGHHYRSIWRTEADGVKIIDQTRLPHQFALCTLDTLDDFVVAIHSMQVRGAPLIGATAAYGVAVHMDSDPSDHGLDHAVKCLRATRPTAVNLERTLCRCETELRRCAVSRRAAHAYGLADGLCEDDITINQAIASHGMTVIRDLADKTAGRPLHILTHCNAGWLATVDHGTATSPLYRAHDEGIALHVWVDETRPRNQGALTAWELGNHGIDYSYVTDNAGGHLMQCGQVDMVIVGTDRTLADGTVCNKIGTYLKALAARDNNVPFYVALPSSSIDWTANRTASDIPIEQRADDEVSHVVGMTTAGDVKTLRITPPDAAIHNPAFDITPPHLVTGLITERGVCAAHPHSLKQLFSEQE